MGSGCTLRAVKDIVLDAVGIEIEERYCRKEVTRMEQGTLFSIRTDGDEKCVEWFDECCQFGRIRARKNSTLAALIRVSSSVTMNSLESATKGCCLDIDVDPLSPYIGR